MRIGGLVACVLALPLIVAGQECGTLTQSGDDLTITVDSTRPMLSLADTLAEKYGVLVSAEEPTSISSPQDMEDVHAAYPESKAKKHWLVPKRRHLEIHTQAGPGGKVKDMHQLLLDSVRVANEEMPFGYRVDSDGEFFALVPTQTRDAGGNVKEAIPLLDRRVSIPNGTRSIAESAAMMADQLSAQTGLKVSCCQTLVAGVPWGMPQVPFQASNEPARHVLERLIRLDAENDALNGSLRYWTLSCDNGWCFINTWKRFSQVCEQWDPPVRGQKDAR